VCSAGRVRVAAFPQAYGRCGGVVGRKGWAVDRCLNRSRVWHGRERRYEGRSENRMDT